MLRASVVNLSCGRGGEMKSRSESQKGERLIRGASTSGLASEEPPGRPGNGWRGLSGLDSGSAAPREHAQEKTYTLQQVE